MSTPCTAFVAIAHYQHNDDTPTILMAKVEFEHGEGDVRYEAIARLRAGHAGSESWAADLLAYDVRDHEFALAEVSVALAGHGLPTVS